MEISFVKEREKGRKEDGGKRKDRRHILIGGEEIKKLLLDNDQEDRNGEESQIYANNSIINIDDQKISLLYTMNSSLFYLGS